MNAATILQATAELCCTHLFYFIAHVTTAAIKSNKTITLLQHLYCFYACETTPQGKRLIRHPWQVRNLFETIFAGEVLRVATNFHIGGCNVTRYIVETRYECVTTAVYTAWLMRRFESLGILANIISGECGNQWIRQIEIFLHMNNCSFSGCCCYGSRYSDARFTGVRKIPRY